MSFKMAKIRRGRKATMRWLDFNKWESLDTATLLLHFLRSPAASHQPLRPWSRPCRALESFIFFLFGIYQAELFFRPHPRRSLPFTIFHHFNHSSFFFFVSAAAQGCAVFPCALFLLSLGWLPLSAQFLLNSSLSCIQHFYFLSVRTIFAFSPSFAAAELPKKEARQRRRVEGGING